MPTPQIKIVLRNAIRNPLSAALKYLPETTSVKMLFPARVGCSALLNSDLTKTSQFRFILMNSFEYILSIYVHCNTFFKLDENINVWPIIEAFLCILHSAIVLARLVARSDGAASEARTRTLRLGAGLRAVDA